MSPKNVLLTIHHAPHGSVFFAEGLRAAMGVTASTDDQNIEVVFLGDGAYAALAGVDRGEAVTHIAALRDWGYGLKVERESLAERGILVEEVAPDVEIISRSSLLALIHAADFTMDF